MERSASCPREPEEPRRPSGIDLTIFALLTCCRRDEGATLQWSNVNIHDEDPSNCWWHIDDRKRGDPITLPLSSQAVTLLNARRAVVDADLAEGKRVSAFVFPSCSKAGHIRDARAPMELISGIVGKRLSLHDLRRSFTNYAMRECLIEKFRTDLLTGHKPAQEDITARNYLDPARLDWLQPEVQKIADWIEQQAAIAASKNVVPLHAAGAAKNRATAPIGVRRRVSGERVTIAPTAAPQREFR